MRLSFWVDRLHRQDGLPKEIYISLVGSLYQDARTLFIGSIGVAAAAFITAVRTGEAWLLLCAVAMPAIAYLRVLDIRRFGSRRESIKTVEAARVWELRYVAGSAASVLLIGAWCLATFIVSTDPFLRLLSFSTTLAYLTGILRAELLEPDPRAHADRRRRHPAVARPDGGRQRLLAHSRRRDHPPVLEHQLHLRAAASHSLRRADIGARRSLARQPLRHRTQQHAARPHHVRCGPQPGRRQQPHPRHVRSLARYVPQRRLGQGAARRIRRVPSGSRKPMCTG